MTIFPKVSKTAVLCKMAKGGPRKNFQKWPILWAIFGRLKNRKYKSSNSLISMDGKLNYHRLILCRISDEKKRKTRNYNFLKGVKNRGFLQNSKGGTKGIKF